MKLVIMEEVLKEINHSCRNKLFSSSYSFLSTPYHIENEDNPTILRMRIMFDLSVGGEVYFDFSFFSVVNVLIYLLL